MPYYGNQQNFMNQPGYSSYYQAPQPNYQSYLAPAAQPQIPSLGINWVDGEVGAKAFQLPAGFPAGVPIDLWDTNDKVIYLKSINPAGMPNPLQKLRYTFEDQPQTNYLPSGSSSTGNYNATNENFVTKDDLNSFKNEIREMLKPNQSGRNQNGNGNMSSQSNRGGNQ